MNPKKLLLNFLKRQSRRSLYVFAFVSFCVLIHEANAQNNKPNIIFILGDDVGYKSLKIDGGNLYSTPYIDTMARQGMRFTGCHATPLCSPSRQMLLTGKYNFRNYYKWGFMSGTEKTFGNMMRDAGYKTGFFGKEQMGGDGRVLNSWGFDSYCAYNVTVGTPAGSKYKNPHLYTHGAFLPDAATLNKYGPDIISDSVLSFIEQNKSNPFFIYYPIVFVHTPFSPTPDDPEFASWDPNNPPDTTFFGSMMHYMDKKVGVVIAKLKSLGIDNNTVIIFSGDNGTPPQAADYGDDDDSIVLGGKKSTTEAGTHVPLIAYWPGTIAPGTVNNDLIDFTDFFPTFAGIANIPVPTNYGSLDGVSFAPRLTGQPGTPRDWIFYHYDFKPGISQFYRWAQTDTYKLYDTSGNKQRLFYNISNDVNENHPIADPSLTTQEVIIKQQLLDVINGYVAQGTPLLSPQPVMSFVNDSTVTIKDTIRTNGGSTVKASGAVWSISPNPDISSSNHASTNVIWGPFSTTITGLAAGTTYYIRAYATNFAGTAYSNQIIITTSAVPVATAATAIDSTKFTANWNTFQGATGYRLDVSTSPTFTKTNIASLTEGFNNGITPPAGWTISNNINANTSVFGAASPSLEFTAAGAQVVTKQLTGPAKQLKFWFRGLNTNAQSTFIIEGFDGYNWQVITTLKNPNTNGITRTFNATSNPPLQQKFIQFRFTYTKKAGTLIFDDVFISYNNTTPSFVAGYNNLSIKTTSRVVSGLNAGTNYYYRVRAQKGSTITGNSNIISVTTCNKPVITDIITNIPTCSGINNGSISLDVTGGIAPLTYNWAGPNGFTSTESNIDNLAAGNYHLNIKSNGGCGVDTNIAIIQPLALSATTNADPIGCAGGTTTLTVNATGGTGAYHYTLSDGTITTGPQDDNHFMIVAGDYTITVTDDNQCPFTTSSVHIGEPGALTVSANADPIACVGGPTTLTVTVTGGTGAYHYTLFDGTNTTGPQDDNHFTGNAGNYTTTVTDDNGCQNNASISIADGTDNCSGIAFNDQRNSSNIKSAKEADALKVQVFPNPATDKFSIHIQSRSKDNIEIIITDVYGKKVYEATGNNYNNGVIGGKLSPGIYFIKVMQGQNIKKLKLIKQK